MYSFQSRVRYSETTREQQMDLFSIINYFQDCSNFHSEDLGVGIDYLTGQHRIWLLSSWQIEINHYPKLFDHICIGTWAYDFKGLYGYRNFILYNDDAEHSVAAYANSIWFLIDTDTQHPTRILPTDTSAYTIEPPYPMEYAPRKIVLPSSADDSLSPVSFPAIPVTQSLLDTNNHVNNGQYVRLAESCLPEGFQLRGMRAEYRRAALLGDLLYPQLVCSAESDRCYVSLNDVTGQPFAVIEFHQ